MFRYGKKIDLESDWRWRLERAVTPYPYGCLVRIQEAPPIFGRVVKYDACQSQKRSERVVRRIYDTLFGTYDKGTAKVRNAKDFLPCSYSGYYARLSIGT